MLLSVVEKYDLVGRLLKPGDEPADYTDTEEEHAASDRLKDDWLTDGDSWDRAAVHFQWCVVSLQVTDLNTFACMWWMYFAPFSNLVVLME